MKRLPPQTPDCIRDAGIVLEKHPTAEAYYDRPNNVVRVGHDNGATDLGFGGTAEAAWADAARNVQRAAIPELPNRGSPTWSLKSDEVFWKHAEKPEQSQPVSAERPASSGGTGNNTRNEGEADLSSLNM